MTPLDPLRIPLDGLALIEASAGTGKTYTIATLYLRLLLERGLEVDRILVVTFTQAATEELRDRIRRRLALALAWLQGERKDEDATLAALLSALPDPEAARAALADALTRMDEAAIHTIHGFCQRTLQDNAFESGAAFEAELITDEERLRATAAQDFWRARVARADPAEARRLRERWRSPAALLDDLRPSLPLDDLRLLPDLDEAGVARICRERDQVFASLKQIWRERAGEVGTLLETDKTLNRRSYTAKVVPRVIQAAEDLVASAEPPATFDDDLKRLTPAVLAEKGAKPGGSPLSDPFFDLCGRLEHLAALAETAVKALFLRSARASVRNALDRRKRDEALLYFDDLLRRLDQALAGEGADTLAANLRERFPVALIDEFQDTDPQQYRIFRRVYAGRPGCGLFLIGDPKQAIYAFRGADIFTYMAAREDSEREGRQYTLGTNRRSGSRLVRAVNALFAAREAPFVYEHHIQFHPVDPGPKADEALLRLEGMEPVPLRFWMLAVSEENRTRSHVIRVEAAREEAARACAEHVAHLLNLADGGRATLGDRPLLPKDIALLVRTHREGDLVQRALRTCGVSSVTLGQDSVLAGDDAQELSTLLEALADLGHEGRMRAALATGLLGRTASELETLARDEVAWEALLARFQGYRDLWQAQGFMVALQELIAEEGVAVRLLQRPDGERRLTNLLQLAELLQVASREHPGMDGLLRWLADQRAGGERDEARQLRLESDEGLVKVVTMHKSKGLEYPLVFIPFPWSYTSPKDPPPPFFHDAGDKAPCLDLGSADLERHRDLERTEQLAERLRLFYVAVTRAAKLCVLCWGRVNGAEGSAPAYLLHPDDKAANPGSRMKDLSEAQIRAGLEALAAGAPDGIRVADLPAPTGERWAGPRVDRARLAPARFAGAIDDAWRVASYSGLVRGAETEQPDYDPAPAAEPPPEEAEAAADPLFELPAGTHAGHLLHEVFEQVDFPQAGGRPLDAKVRELLERYGQLRTGRGGRDARRDWAPVVRDLVTNVLDTPLDEAGTLRLRQIGAGDRLAELEFHFPVEGLDPLALRALLADSPDYGPSAQGLGFEPLRGLMRGFIDLVFRHRGRYYVADYKSNLLGRRLSAYDRDGMRQAIRQHRYDLQYLIYTLALHRFLGRRLPGYDYDTHFGGVYYLFLRGMRPGQGPRYGVWHDRPEPALIERLDRHFAGIEEVA